MPGASARPDSGGPAARARGAYAIQRYVHQGVIDKLRAAAIKGSVTTRDGAPLQGVRISILGHSELGETATAPSGSFTMLVNGGSTLVLEYEKDGYIPIQRKVHAGWGRYVFAEDAVMIPHDSQVTEIDLVSSNQTEVARGSVIIDVDGTRQATIIFPPEVEAAMVKPDGSTEPLPVISVRATEFTVGETGPQAMPAELPSNMSYSYAVELTVDEALAAGADKVVFSESVFLYVENIVQASVGSAVPFGIYDRPLGGWLSSRNGRVVSILDVVADRAVLDLSGDALPATAEQLEALNVTPQELVKLAELYNPGTELWRVPLEHFSAAGGSWPSVGPGGAPPWGGVGEGEEGPGDDDECFQGSTRIACFKQGLRENIPLNGSPYNLHYESENIRTAASFNVVMTTEALPDDITTLLSIAAPGMMVLGAVA